MGVVALLLAVPALASPATLIKLEGSVWVTPPEGKETTATVGARLTAGTRVRTGAESSAELRFENGSTLKLRPNSSMALSGNKRTSESKSSVVLFFGRLWSKVVPSDSGNPNYEVNTPNAVCGVRGTEFETAVGDDGSVRVDVSEGEVGVGQGGDEPSAGVRAGSAIDGDERGLGDVESSSGETDWKAWQKEGKDRLKKDGRTIVDGVKNRILSRKAAIEALRKQQTTLEARRKDLEARARRGDNTALDGIRTINEELAEIADAIADLGDETESQFGLVDHFADLAEDPRFKLIDRKYLVSQAASLRRIKADLDRMVKDGTDISMEAMDKMLDDMSSGKGGGLKDDSGSAKDLFGGDDEMDMDMR